MKIDNAIKQSLTKGSISISSYYEIFQISLIGNDQKEILQITSDRGIEHLLMLFISKTLSYSAFANFAEKKYPYPKGVGKRTEFESVILKSHIHMYMIKDVLTIEQEQTQAPKLNMTPGTYRRKGIGHSFDAAIKDLLASTDFTRLTCLCNDPLK